MSRFLPYAEFRYGYKLEEDQIRNQDTEIFNSAYLLYYNRIWDKINSRNLIINIPYGMQLIERKAFDEEAIREAVNNAVIHRDYTRSESTIIMQYQTRIELRSPGGLPEGVTINNIIDETRPRNKLIADVLYKCDLVEQFGNGVDLMFTKQLGLGKMPPDFSASNDSHVSLRLDGRIQDIEFAKYVIAVADQKNKQLNDKELIALTQIKAGKTLKPSLVTRSLLDMGLIEQLTPRRYMLSKQYYADTNQRSQYTRQKGLSKNKNKQLILQHLRDFGSGKKNDFRGIFNPGLLDPQIYSLLHELKKEDFIYLDGRPTSIHSSWNLTDKGRQEISDKKIEVDRS
jgi:ATP-dependent DNA helicase RecG